jgi:hypothetical protein
MVRRSRSSLRRLLLGALAFVAPVAVFELREAPQAEPQEPAAPSPLIYKPEPVTYLAETTNAVARLQDRIDSGQTRLTFDARHGYLRSVLDELDIPLASQMLVFSKSSAQMGGIAPDKPRAIYFNDDAYVGWVAGGGLELAAVDPKGGPFFYTLTQLEDSRPRFERHTLSCVGCHNASDEPGGFVPRLLMLSVLPDSDGTAIGAAALATTDASPFRERWGGWYVTGTHGRQPHLGNQVFRDPGSGVRSIPEHVAGLDLSRGGNVTSLSEYFDTGRYPTPHSDIVALMVLAHQTHVHNLIAAANYALAEALAANPDRDTAGLARDLAEPVVRAMLFSGEAALSSPVAGTSGFATEFGSRGPRDSQGRSLRDLDLQTRLLRYPLSYVIYSDAFDQMPDALKNYVYARFHAVLSGEDQTPRFAHLSAADRNAILSILNDTKPEFATFARK